jgi:hypothetical protein
MAVIVTFSLSIVGFVSRCALSFPLTPVVLFPNLIAVDINIPIIRAVIAAGEISLVKTIPARSSNAFAMAGSVPTCSSTTASSTFSHHRCVVGTWNGNYGT